MKFDEEALIKISGNLANLNDLPEPSREQVSAKIHEILVERENYECALQGILTREETASLILQHLQTLICNHAHQCESDLRIGWSSLVGSTVQALFVE